MKKLNCIFAITVIFAFGCSTSNQGETATDSAQEQLDANTVVEAVTTMNLELCTTISEDSQKKDCEVKVKDAIVLKEAQEKGDKSLCSQIVELNTQSKCEITVEEILSEQDAAKQLLEDQKKESEIVKSKDIKKCEEINDDRLKKQCQTNIYLKLARDEKDPSYCDKIEDVQIKDICKSQTL